jgi:hypothetical protein
VRAVLRASETGETWKPGMTRLEGATKNGEMPSK